MEWAKVNVFYLDSVQQEIKAAEIKRKHIPVHSSPNQIAYLPLEQSSPPPTPQPPVITSGL